MLRRKRLLRLVERAGRAADVCGYLCLCGCACPARCAQPPPHAVAVRLCLTAFRFPVLRSFSDERMTWVAEMFSSRPFLTPTEHQIAFVPVLVGLQ